MIHVVSQKKLNREFPPSISKKFVYTYLAKDVLRNNNTGEISPGIGGNVYEKLGFRGQLDKNKHLPDIVQERLFSHV